jgi:hypothetical protein
MLLQRLRKHFYFLETIFLIRSSLKPGFRLNF